MAAPNGSLVSPLPPRPKSKPSPQDAEVEDPESFKAFLATLLDGRHLAARHEVKRCWRRHFPGLELPGAPPRVPEEGKSLKRAFILSKISGRNPFDLPHRAFIRCRRV